MSKVSISGWQLLRWFVVLSTSLLIAYVGLTTEYGIEGLRLRNWGLITLAATLVVWGYACWCERRGCHKKGLAAMGLLSASTLGTLVIADTLYNVSLNRWATPLPFSFETTPQGLGLELQLKLPRFRTENGGRNKPHSVIGGEVCGELVPPALVGDSELQRTVIERRWVEYRLDEYGFRKTQTSWENAKVIAIGDSFVFGSGIANEKTWVAHLESEGVAVYNLGEAGTTPPEQIVRLRENQSKVPSEHVTTILWMIFGGNDLDAPHTEFGDDSSRLVEGTLAIGPLRGIEAIRDKSILARVRRGTLVPLRYPEAYWYQGKLMPAPIYHSERFGAKWFYPPYIREAQRTEQEVLQDPEMPALRRSMENLSEIGEQAGWRVLVLYAPSAEALFGSDFAGFPGVTSETPFSNWLSSESARVGFEYLDLSQSLRESSDSRFPYFRDDTHWNEWGHEIVSREVIERLRLLGWDDLLDSAQ